MCVARVLWVCWGVLCVCCVCVVCVLCVLCVCCACVVRVLCVHVCVGGWGGCDLGVDVDVCMVGCV